MKKVARADVVIFGGGVAGLWLLDQIRKTGLSAILFESGYLGGGQTHKAQGILHGGAKYSLQGVMTSDAQAVNSMPEIWSACLAGRGETDLSGVSILSRQHFLWSPNKLTAKLTGFLAGAALSSKVSSVPRDQLPEIFKTTSFQGEVFAVDETVIDVNGLVRELVKNNQDAIFKIEPFSDQEMMLDEEGFLRKATVYLAGQALEVESQQFIFAAGAGNEAIIKNLGTKEVAMQRRPLHMVMVKTPFNFPLYAHCLGIGARPRVTFTTHYQQDGSTIWYLGGQLAEDGVNRSPEAQIKATLKELEQLFPWINFKQAEFSTFFVDRAEPQQKNGFKPANAYFKKLKNMYIAWPTKLVLAPKLAADIIADFKNSNVVPRLLDLRELRAWPIPPLAKPIWEEAFCKNVA